MSLLHELIRLMIRRRKYWLMPVLFIMAGLGVLIVFGQGSVVAPFIYTLF